MNVEKISLFIGEALGLIFGLLAGIAAAAAARAVWRHRQLELPE